MNGTPGSRSLRASATLVLDRGIALTGPGTDEDAVTGTGEKAVILTGAAIYVAYLYVHLTSVVPRS